MTKVAGAPVVVGVDGSDESLRAVTLAARLAAERARPLRIVHALAWAYLHVPLGPPPGGPLEGGLANEAKRIVDDALARVQTSHPDVSVSGEVIAGSAAPTLLDEARNAVMIVLGSRGLGGFTGLLVGSVAVQVSAHAPCPVVVARGEIDREGDILVGVDGSPGGAGALEFAMQEASLRGVGVTALHAYVFPATADSGDMLPLVYDAEQLAENEAAVLGEAVSGLRERYPDVPLHEVLVRDRPARAIVKAAEQASLVVVGSRGRGGFAGLLLGSVSHAVLHHASCPVVIVRHR